MSGGISGHDLSHDPKKIAAVMAAVQAYLNQETSGPVHNPRRPQRLWRLALWPQLNESLLRGSAKWNGRN